ARRGEGTRRSLSGETPHRAGAGGRGSGAGEGAAFCRPLLRTGRESSGHRAFVVVDELAFVVVFGADEASPSGDRLRRLIRLEAAEELLFTFGCGIVPESPITEHRRIV